MMVSWTPSPLAPAAGGAHGAGGQRQEERGDVGGLYHHAAAGGGPAGARLDALAGPLRPGARRGGGAIVFSYTVVAPGNPETEDSKRQEVPLVAYPLAFSTKHHVSCPRRAS